MKFLKLSKTSWLILAAGVFVVVLAGLGITRAQQLKEQDKIEKDLSTALNSLNGFQVTELQASLGEFQQKIDEEQLKLEEVKSRLDKTVVSVAVTDQFFSIAEYCNVVIVSMTTSPISTKAYGGVKLQTTAIGASVTGTVDNLIQFVLSLNNDFTTGMVKSFQIDIPDDPDVPPTL